MQEIFGKGVSNLCESYLPRINTFRNELRTEQSTKSMDPQFLRIQFLHITPYDQSPLNANFSHQPARHREQSVAGPQNDSHPQGDSRDPRLFRYTGPLLPTTRAGSSHDLHDLVPRQEATAMATECGKKSSLRKGPAVNFTDCDDCLAVSPL